MTNEETCQPGTGFHTSLGSWRTHYMYTNSISNCYTHTGSRKSVSYRSLNRNVNPKPMPYIKKKIHIKLYKVYKMIADWMPVNH